MLSQVSPVVQQADWVAGSIIALDSEVKLQAQLSHIRSFSHQVPHVWYESDVLMQHCLVGGSECHCSFTSAGVSVILQSVWHCKQGLKLNLWWYQCRWDSAVLFLAGMSMVQQLDAMPASRCMHIATSWQHGFAINRRRDGAGGAGDQDTSNNINVIDYDVNQNSSSSSSYNTPNEVSREIWVALGFPGGIDKHQWDWMQTGLAMFSCSVPSGVQTTSNAFIVDNSWLILTSRACVGHGVCSLAAPNVFKILVWFKFDVRISPKPSEKIKKYVLKLLIQYRFNINRVPTWQWIFDKMQTISVLGNSWYM